MRTVARYFPFQYFLQLHHRQGLQDPHHTIEMERSLFMTKIIDFSFIEIEYFQFEQDFT